jgi:hypothetical protein
MKKLCCLACPDIQYCSLLFSQERLVSACHTFVLMVFMIHKFVDGARNTDSTTVPVNIRWRMGCKFVRKYYCWLSSYTRRWWIQSEMVCKLQRYIVHPALYSLHITPEIKKNCIVLCRSQFVFFCLVFDKCLNLTYRPSLTWTLWALIRDGRDYSFRHSAQTDSLVPLSPSSG